MMLFPAFSSFYFPARDAEVLSQESSPIPASKPDIPVVTAFFALIIIGGHIGVPLVLFTLFVTKGLRRHPMLVNFLITWVIYSTSFCLLLYFGQQFGNEPPYALCILQASTIYGTSVLTATAGLAFVLNLWLTLRDLSTGKGSIEHSQKRNYLLLAAPYIFFLSFVVFYAILGTSHRVTRDQYFFYCTIHSDAVDIVSAGTAAVMFAIIVLEILIAVKLYRLHKTSQRMQVAGKGPPPSLVARVMIFSVYSFLSIIACISFWSSTGAQLPYLIQASLPTAAFAIFGTQGDLLETWGVLRLASWIRSHSQLFPFVIVLNRTAGIAHEKSKQPQIERQGPTFAPNSALTASIALSTLTPVVTNTKARVSGPKQ